MIEIIQLSNKTLMLNKCIVITGNCNIANIRDYKLLNQVHARLVS